MVNNSATLTWLYTPFFSNNIGWFRSRFYLKKDKFLQYIFINLFLKNICKYALEMAIILFKVNDGINTIYFSMFTKSTAFLCIPTKLNANSTGKEEFFSHKYIYVL